MSTPAPSLIPLQIPNDVKVVVPDDARLMTPYVLSEQGDWFEDDIRWLRSWFSKGMRVLDIGANYGTYALTACKQADTEGKVWAIEPTPSVFEALEESKRVNGFENLSLLKVAISNFQGQSSFYVSNNAELNTLEPTEGNEEIKVETTTLDDLVAKEGMVDLDFVKIDAEGQELKILEKGTSLFEQQSPLILYEVDSGEGKKNLDLVDAFEALGYKPYYLLTDYDVLVPFDRQSGLKVFWLNLFGCKDDRASKIEKEHRLCRELSTLNFDDYDNDSYLESLSRYPYFKRLQDQGISPIDSNTPAGDEYRIGLNLYFASKDESTSISLRASCALASYDKLFEAFKKHPTIARLMTLSRVACAVNQRDIAVNVLLQASKSIEQEKKMNITEPFLSPFREYDLVDPEDYLARWISASILEQTLRIRSHSSYFLAKEHMTFISLLKKIAPLTNRVQNTEKLINSVFNH